MKAQSKPESVRAWRVFTFLLHHGVSVAEAARLVAEDHREPHFQSVAHKADHLASDDLLEALAADLPPVAQELFRLAMQRGVLTWCGEALMLLLQPRTDRVWAIEALVAQAALGLNLSEAAQIVLSSLEAQGAPTEALRADLDLLIEHGRPPDEAQAVARASHLFPPPMPHFIDWRRGSDCWEGLRPLLEELRSGRLPLPPVEPPTPAEAVERLLLLLGLSWEVTAASEVVREVGPWLGADLEAWTELAWTSYLLQGEELAEAAKTRPDLFSPVVVRLLRCHPGVLPKVLREMVEHMARGEL